ncbi:MAG: hypothetical protein WA364_13940 [Candidatus Nitrosopolaris sp.]
MNEYEFSQFYEISIKKLSAEGLDNKSAHEIATSVWKQLPNPNIRNCVQIGRLVKNEPDIEMAIAFLAATSTTTLTIGATTTLAVSNTHTHQFQLTGNDDKGFVISSPSSNEFGDFNSAQYAWSHPHHHHSSMIADYNGDNSNSTAGSDDRGGFSSTQYGSSDSHPHNHKDSTPNSSWMWPTHHTAPDNVDID